MKMRFMALFLSVVLLLGGCHRMVPEEAGEQLVIYASFSPIYAIAAAILDGVPDVTLKCLTQPQDGCPRAYQLSEWDAVVLPLADALLIGGRGLESFESAVQTSALPVVVLMDGLDLIGQDQAVADADEAGHFDGANPWLWMSLDGALSIARSIEGAMAQLDPRYAQLYEENLDAFEEALNRLDRGGARSANVAVMHEGLAYFAQSMGLTVTATIRREPGSDLESGELDAALEALAQAPVDLILIEAQAPDRLIRDLSDAGYTLVKLDTLTTLSQADANSYAEAMARNIDALRAARP